MLNNQLIKRNEELAVLYEELKLQNSLLSKGQEQFEEKQNDLNNLLEADREMQDQLEIADKEVEKYEKLKSTIQQRQRQLVEEKLKVKALTDELAKPINIHRWRRLKDTSAESYGTIKRVRKLQKSIIRKTDQVEQKDNLIQQKEKLYVDLRRVLARQPGAEAAEQLRLYTKTLKQKRAAFRTLKAELKMYQAKVYEYKYDVQRLQHELQLLNVSYFDQQRKSIQASSGRHSVGSSRPQSSFQSGYNPDPNQVSIDHLVAAPPSNYQPPADPFGPNAGAPVDQTPAFTPGATGALNTAPPGSPPRDPFGAPPPTDPFAAPAEELAETNEEDLGQPGQSLDDLSATQPMEQGQRVQE